MRFRRDLSYNLPTKSFLSQDQNDESKFQLKQKFGFPFESMIAEEFTLRVVLPEGAKGATVIQSYKDIVFSN